MKELGRDDGCIRRDWERQQYKDEEAAFHGNTSPSACSARPWLGKRVVSYGTEAGWEDGASGIVAEHERQPLDGGWFDLVMDDGSRRLAHIQEFHAPNAHSELSAAPADKLQCDVGK